jgi:hypothetical protein
VVDDARPGREREGFSSHGFDQFLGPGRYTIDVLCRHTRPASVEVEVGEGEALRVVPVEVSLREE